MGDKAHLWTLSPHLFRFVPPLALLYCREEGASTVLCPPCSRPIFTPASLLSTPSVWQLFYDQWAVFPQLCVWPTANILRQMTMTRSKDCKNPRQPLNDPANIPTKKSSSFQLDQLLILHNTLPCHRNFCLFSDSEHQCVDIRSYVGGCNSLLCSRIIGK